MTIKGEQVISTVTTLDVNVEVPTATTSKLAENNPAVSLLNSNFKQSGELAGEGQPTTVVISGTAGTAGDRQ